MGRSKQIKIAALNIKLNPSGEIERYKDLLIKVVDLRAVAKVYANDYITFRDVKEYESPQYGIVLAGHLVRFTEVDDEFPAYNTDSCKDQKIDWPKEVKPNRRNIEFVFVPKIHRLLYNTRYLTPNGAFRVCEELFNKDEICNNFGHIAIEIETDVDALERIKNMKKKKSFFVSITIPNPDAPTEAAEKVIKRLRDINVDKAKLEEISEAPEGMSFGEEEQGWLDLAKSNGYAIAKGWEEDFQQRQQRVEINTQRHPAVRKCDVVSQTEEGFFEQFVKVAINGIKDLIGSL